ncbi:hypothetical protein CDV31_011679 [Fusarium ambrosium]|uniref:Zn(2)-C6 fungal-type domain-containing protein n=1 Tax=Fusarium ambrosium TaxID=131363 RepID=A0A428TFC4_9HYPO|nr:hypothetical protein CDV31_011679 [Fusarium ambrosium]
MPAESRSDTNSSQGRKSRTKSFSGCWTCRAKHVKCDEARPTCNRCQRSGIECEGYEVRLSWTSVRNPSTFRPRTASKRKAAQRATNRLLQTRPLDVVEETDSPQESPATETEETAPPDEPLSGESAGQDLQPETISTPESTQYPRPHVQQEPFNGGLNSRIFHSYELLGQGLATRVSYVPLQQEQEQHQPLPDQPRSWEQSSRTQDNVNTSNGFTPASIPDLSTSNLVITGVSQPTSPSPVRSHEQYQHEGSDTHTTRHLDTLHNPGLECELLEHWTLRLCDSLNPVPGIHNPMRTAMMPIALEGSRTDSKKATGATALFHLICSASAFHLAPKRPTPESRRALENVALEHHNIGITHLAQNIRSDDRNQCVPLLASVVMCIMNEAITLPTQFWRLHFRGAVEWVNHIEPQVWRQSEAASAVYQMFIGMATLVQAQLLFDGHQTSFWHFAYDPRSQPEPYALNLAIGLPQPILQGIHTMNTIQMRKKSLNGQGIAPTRQALDRLELELYLSVPGKPDASTSREYGDLIYHHGCTFYYAALLYMKRTLKDTPVADVQPLVKQSLNHLEAMQTSTTERFSPMIWPVAIIAFEILDVGMQHRMLKCLDFFLDRSDLAIWAQIRHLVRDLWSLRKGSSVNLKWHETLLGSMSDSFMLL